MDNLKIEKDDNQDASGYVLFNLHQYNQQHCKYIREHSSNNHNDKINGDFIVWDNDEVIGGAIGYIEYGWYFLTDFYLNAKYRDHGLGSKVIQKVEEFALSNHAVGVRVESWDFQAPKFYQKLGYTVWGEFKDCPLGTTCYHLFKRLNDETRK